MDDRKYGYVEVFWNNTREKNCRLPSVRCMRGLDELAPETVVECHFRPKGSVTEMVIVGCVGAKKQVYAKDGNVLPDSWPELLPRRKPTRHMGINTRDYEGWWKVVKKGVDEVVENDPVTDDQVQREDVVAENPRFGSSYEDLIKEAGLHNEVIARLRISNVLELRGVERGLAAEVAREMWNDREEFVRMLS